MELIALFAVAIVFYYLGRYEEQKACERRKEKLEFYWQGIVNELKSENVVLKEQSK